MRKLPLVFGVLGGLALGIDNSSALSFSDTDLYGSQDQGIRLYYRNSTLTDTFNIASYDGDGANGAGFNPGSMFVSSAVAEFWFQDDADDPAESVAVDLGDLTLGPTSVNMSITTLSGAATANIIADLNDDGQVEYTVRRVTGDFIVLKGELRAQASYRETPTNQVPDAGASLSLLGLSLLGLIGVGRKLKA